MAIDMRRAGAKIWDFLRVLVLFAVLAVFSAFLANYAAEDYSGVPKVLDGDSLIVAGQEIRLKGLDAPEYKQSCKSKSAGSTFACGRAALDHLKRLIGGREIDCRGWETDKYQRVLATCSVDATLLNEQMVLDGWAISFGGYSRLEEEAKEARRGLWAHEFVSPAEWRRQSQETHTSGLLDSFLFW